ncbi:MAG: CRISPR-associated protein Csx1 [Geotoga sp.]|nr:CRISPR-associated protein Csx1 [Geotoga sp.]
MKVLFAIAGNLDNFKEKRYRLNLEENEENFICESSLKLLSKHYNVDKIVIFVPDTLFTTCKIDKIPKSYFELTTRLSDVYNKKIKEKLKIDNFELFVVPGIGTYNLGNDQVTFEGEIKDLYNFTLYKLYKLLLHEQFLKAEGIEFIFDITLGLNYQQNVIFNVLNDLLKLLSYLKDTRLIIVNSEPVIGNLKEVLNVHIVDSKKVFPGLDIQKIKRKKILEIIPVLSNEEKKCYGQKYIKNLEQIVRAFAENDFDTFIKVILYFLNSLIYGLPLVFLHYNKKINAEKIIEKIVEFYLNAIEINNNLVFRKLKFGEVFKYVIFAELFRKYFNNMGIEYDVNEIPFDILEKASKLIWKIDESSNDLRNNSFISLSIEKELYEIKNYHLEYLNEDEEIIFKKKTENKNNLFDEMRKKDSNSNKTREKTRFNPKRNFLAHSGLSEGTFKIKKKNGNLYLSAIENKISENLKGLV